MAGAPMYLYDENGNFARDEKGYIVPRFADKKDELNHALNNANSPYRILYPERWGKAVDDPEPNNVTDTNAPVSGAMTDNKDTLLLDKEANRVAAQQNINLSGTSLIGNTNKKTILGS